MRKVHEKSVVLGIGIGMIITAIAGMIFSAGTPKELSKAEIISMAKGYGLVEQVRFLNNENSQSTNTVTESSTTKSAADSTSTNSTTTNSTTTSDSSSNSTERDIIIEIKDGYKSQDVINELLEKGVITSTEDFLEVLNSYKASRSILVGNFKFKRNEDLHYIVKTICKLE